MDYIKIRNRLKIFWLFVSDFCWFFEFICFLSNNGTQCNKLLKYLQFLAAITANVVKMLRPVKTY